MKNKKRIKKLETEIKLRDSQVSGIWDELEAIKEGQTFNEIDSEGIEDQLRQTNIRISRLTERFETLQKVTVARLKSENWNDIENETKNEN
tara:strand:- start:652 stop:924 length:273 start_codon:yes stop_codon:yes gene_type:complete